MQNLKMMGKKEVEELARIVRKNYGFVLKTKNFAFFKNKEGKVWIADKKLSGSFLKAIKVYAVGLYFCRMKKGGKVKLSIESSQIVGEKAKKNVVEITGDEAKKWCSGMDVRVSKKHRCDYNNFVIVKCGNDFLGSGVLRERDVVENLVPKVRRIKFKYI